MRGFTAGSNGRRAAWLLALTAMTFACIRLRAADAPATSPATGPTTRIADVILPSLVRVEYTVQFDKGEPPTATGWAERCPSCGQFHGGGSAEELVKEERPLEIGGAVLAPTRVISGDPMIHPRFIKSIAVRWGQQVVPARIAAYATEQNALILETAEPLTQATPLAFDASRSGPYLAVTYQEAQGQWTLSAQPLSAATSVAEHGRRFIAVPSYCLIVDKAGGAVSMCMKDELPADDSWKTSPATWPTLSADEMAALLKNIEKQADATLVRVTLNFRSPKAGPERDYMPRDDARGATEQHVLGVMCSGKSVLVLAEMKPAITARLEKIRIYPPQGQPVAAKFLATLADYGGFVATLEKELDAPAALSPAPITDFRNTLLVGAQVGMQGEKRVCYFAHGRIAGFAMGWRRQLYPRLQADAAKEFLFDARGQLLAIPIARREKAALDERWRSDSRPILTPVAYLKDALAEPARFADAGNVPLSEEQENRLAWLGIEMQGLNRELARANGVSDLTNDGASGGLVTFVYPDSPAAKAGIEPGFILLRLHVVGHPKPLEVKVEDGRYSDEPFPWDRLSEAPEQVFERIPQPWPAAENSFTRTLTDLGFGTAFTAEFFKDGQTIRKDFSVEQGPAHYLSAPKFKAEAIGLTVRDMTYEVRRYLQKKADEPGVVIAKIEMGSKASTAGLKPYELITHVNDQPVANVKEFQKAIEGQTELRLSVKRMTKGRVVKLAPAAAATRPATATAPVRTDGM